MEKRMIMGAALLFLLAVGAAAGACPDPLPPAPRGADRHAEGVAKKKRHLPSLEEALGLSDPQREKVDALLKGARAASASILHKLEENRRELLKDERDATFDEKQVRAHASKEGELRAELTVLRMRTRHEIRRLLTPEQRALYEKRPPAPPRPERGDVSFPGCCGPGTPGGAPPFPLEEDD